MDTLAQFDNIKQKISKFCVESLVEEKKKFVADNKNDIDLMVGFWWYNLEQDYIEKNPEYQGEEGKKEFDEKFPPHGMREAIFSELSDRGLLRGRIQIFSDIEVKNSSAHNKEHILRQLHHGYTKTHIDIRTMCFIDQKTIKKNSEKGINKLFINKPNLYLPSVDCNSENKILNYLSSGIDTCFGILSGESSLLDKKYIKVLKNIGVDIHDHGIIKELQKFLEYIQWSSNSINTMMKDGKDDRKFLKRVTEKNGFKEKFGGKGGGKWTIGPEKTWGRVYQKYIQKYEGDISQVGDLTRMAFFCESAGNMTTKIGDFIEYLGNFPEVEQVDIDDYIGNLTEKAKKTSGYRDSNLKIKLKSGNTVEVQFHFKEYYNFKTKGYVLGKEFLTPEYIRSYHIEKFNDEEATLINEACRGDGEITLPANFYILCDSGKFSFAGGIKKNTSNILSSDTIYSLARVFRHNKDIRTKLEKFESVGYDIAGGKTLASEIPT